MLKFLILQHILEELFEFFLNKISFNIFIIYLYYTVILISLQVFRVKNLIFFRFFTFFNLSSENSKII